jgi:hypothetical protein
VKMGTTANQKKLFFNLRKAKSRISALEEGDLRPDQVQIIAERLGVTEQEVIDMNRRLGSDVSLNAPVREESDSGEWQDWLVDDRESQESILAQSEELENRRSALSDALGVLNERERRIFEARRLVDAPSPCKTSPLNSGFRGSGCARSRCAPSRRCGLLFGVASPPFRGRRHQQSTSRAPASAFPARPELTEDISVNDASSRAPGGIAGHCSSMRTYQWFACNHFAQHGHWRCSALCLGTLAVTNGIVRIPLERMCG